MNVSDDPERSRKVLLIVGPTASGKTTLSLTLGQQISCEIISADSRQVYKFMDIGSAKPTPEERSRIPHHCIDLVEPDAYFSAGEYGWRSRRVVEEVFERGHIPVVVGGSGLYIRALTDGLFSSNVRDDTVRKKLRDQAEKDGWGPLHQQLRDVDPAAGERIHPNDKKRIIRALEVYRLTGRPISELQRSATKPADFIPVYYGLSWDRETLYNRIDIRVDRMIQEGLLDEVTRLRSKGYTSEMNSMDSVGYKEVFAYFNRSMTLDETVDAIKKNTRRYAKRQISWFKRDERIHWIRLDPPVDWQKTARIIIDRSGLNSQPG